jgi:hypothetical protein
MSTYLKNYFKFPAEVVMQRRVVSPGIDPGYMYSSSPEKKSIRIFGVQYCSRVKML